MREYLFKLASGKGKSTCPKCGKAKHWQRYLYVPTGELLPQRYGRCDNEVKCGYWVKPDKEIIDLYKNKTKEFYKPIKVMKKSYFDKEVYKRCAKIEHYEKNEFLQNLLKNVPYPFEKEQVYRVAKMYGIGTIIKGDYSGATCFPFADINGNLHAVQVKKFDASNHTISTNFLHKVLEYWFKEEKRPLPQWLTEYFKNESFVDCLFGEHLLRLPENSKKAVCVVEAPKTAIYATLYFGTDTIWLSCYSKGGLTLDRMKVLAGRKVFLFPDLSENGNTFKEWQAKANYLQANLPNTIFVVADLLEKIASKKERQKGLDIADFLILHDWRQKEYRQPEHTSVLTIDPQSKYTTNTTINEIYAKKNELHNSYIAGFLNESPYIITDTQTQWSVYTPVEFLYAQYCKYMEDKNKKPCSVDFFLKTLLQFGYKVCDNHVHLEKIPF